MDSFTNVYVADAGNNAIFQIATNGAVTTFSSGGGLFNVPEGIAVDSFGNVYVGNTGNNTILGINPGGKSTATIAGTSGSIGSADGLSSVAQFDAPIGVAVDAAGNIYVADELNNTIRKGTPYIAQTVVLTLDTSPSGLPVSVNGTNYPYTPQILAFAASSTNTATITVTNNYAFTNTAGITAANNYAFTNWTLNGSVVGTSTNCTFTLGTNVNETLVANLIPLYTLTVNASPTNDGAVTGGGIFLPGGTNIVTATASNGYVFASWVLNGSVVSTSSNYSFVLGDNDVLVANFLPACTISVSASPGNAGTVGGGGTFVQGITNTVTATASNGFIFTNWTVSNIVVSAASNYTFTLSSNVALVANFLPTYMLAASTSPLNGGNVIGGGTFVQGTTNTVTATAINGFIFADWTVSNIVVSTSPSYNVVLTNNEAIVANFLPLYTITVSAAPGNGGTVSGNGTFVSGSTNTVTANVTNGFIFTDWTVSNVVVSTLANYSFTLNNNVTLVANFLPLYTLTVNAAPVNGGMASGGGIYVSGSTNAVTATPTNGFIFTNWTVGNTVVSTSSSYNVILTSNETIVANILPLYTITVNAAPVNGGTVGGGGTFVFRAAPIP